MIALEGKALKYGDNINTDLISPPQYMELSIKDASQYAMSAVDPEFAKRAGKGSIFVAGKNLGSGSSRETSPLTLRYLGIGAVVAESFARIFYRNCINVGLPALTCMEATKIEDGNVLALDLAEGKIENRTRGETYACDILPDHILEIIMDGGLFAHLKKMRKEN